MSRVPDFLVIGGMKCGSTTVYGDLLTNPSVFFPMDKEPHDLCEASVLSESGRRAYAALFSGARGDQRCGEASTGYTKRPTHEGVVERARELCGPDLRLVYIVRDPVSRVVSHHHHVRTYEEAPESIAEALEALPELLDYSRYAMQAERWVEAFGRERLLIVRFEDYMRDRHAWSARVAEHIGVTPRPDLVDTEAVFNKSEGKPVLTGPWRAITTSWPYRRLVRPIFGLGVRNIIRGAVLPKASHERVLPDPAVIARILDAVSDDHEALASLMGLDEPVWDRAALAAKHTKKYESWVAERAAG